jgi:hypothetical protein
LTEQDGNVPETEDFRAFQRQQAAESPPDQEAEPSPVAEAASDAAPAAETAETSEASEAAPEGAEHKPEHDADADEPEEEADRESEPDEGEPEKSPKPKRRRPKRTVQRRIDELTRRNRELLAKVETLEREKTAPAESAITTKPEEADASEKEQPSPSAKTKNKRDSQDYQDYGDYTYDVAHDAAASVLEEQLDAKLLERDQARKKREAEEAESQRQHTAEKAWAKEVDRGRDLFEDFDEVASNPDVHVSPAMAQILFSSKQAAELAYYLGSNPKEANEMADLDADEAMRRMWQLETSLKPEPEPPPRQKSRAPKPAPRLPAGSPRTGRSTRRPSEDFRSWFSDRPA